MFQTPVQRRKSGALNESPLGLAGEAIGRLKGGNTVGRRGRGLSLGAIYLIVGLVVAAAKDYFDNIEGFKGVLEALIAIIIWPAVLLGVDINVR
jgi:hypothetical protein